MNDTSNPALAEFVASVLDAWSPAGVAYSIGIWNHLPNPSTPPPSPSPSPSPPSSGRRLLISRGASSKTKEPVVYHGYDVFVEDGIEYDLNYNLPNFVNTISRSVNPTSLLFLPHTTPTLLPFFCPCRSVDPRSANIVLSGLYLHLTRKPQISSPFFPQRFVSVPQTTVSECSRSKFASIIAECQSVAQATASTPVSNTQPFGTDPSFNSRSQLYNPALVASDWYNASSSDEVDTNTGLPFAFFHHPVQGYPDGYPLLLSNFIGEGRVLDTLRLMLGSYLDPSSSDTMTAELLTFNRHSRSFGRFSALFKWLGAGVVEMTYSISGFPVMETSWDADKKGLPIAYVCLIVVFIVLSGYFYFSSKMIERKSRWTITGEKLEEHDLPHNEDVEHIMSAKREGLSLRRKHIQQKLFTAKMSSWNPSTGKS